MLSFVWAASAHNRCYYFPDRDIISTLSLPFFLPGFLLFSAEEIRTSGRKSSFQYPPILNVSEWPGGKTSQPPPECPNFGAAIQILWEWQVQRFYALKSPSATLIWCPSSFRQTIACNTFPATFSCGINKEEDVWQYHRWVSECEGDISELESTFI